MLSFNGAIAIKGCDMCYNIQLEWNFTDCVKESLLQNETVFFVGVFVSAGWGSYHMLASYSEAIT